MRVERICVEGLRGIIFDDQILDLRQFVGNPLVVMFVLLVQAFVLVLYMRADLINDQRSRGRRKSRKYECALCR